MVLTSGGGVGAAHIHVDKIKRLSGDGGGTPMRDTGEESTSSSVIECTLVSATWKMVVIPVCWRDLWE
ncbi:hypothetical protein CLOM_g11137 [Closterium sp. NIES-68]|nr:hypothetical protein CLOM_g11137 [Closterium sp. NIES-68]GJP83301.1 hypothetical protein CLOP_g13464 [Closterium sp. NIES-67]